MGRQKREEVNGFKETEIGLLPEDWEVVKLGDRAHIIMGQSPPSATYNDDKNGTPFLQGKAEFGELYPTPVKWCSAPIKIAPIGSILISVRAPVGDVNITPFKCCIGRGLAAINCYDNTDSRFLFYILKFSRFRLQENSSGSTFKSINKSVLQTFYIPIPQLSEQRKIACVIDIIQRAVEQQDKIIAAARELKKSLMRHLFTYGPVPVDQVDRVPLKETEIGSVPEHWQLLKLGEVAQIRYGLGQPPAIDKNGIPMIRATNIKRGQIVHEGLIYVRKDMVPISRNPFLKVGDIIVVRSGAYTGDVAMITPEWGGSIAGYDLVVSPNESIISEFCVQYLLGERAQIYFRGERDRSAQPHLNKNQLSATIIPLPSLSEQRQIAHILSTVDKKIEVEEKRKASLQSLFQTMLHLLMTGRLRVKDLEVNVRDAGL